MLHKVTALPFLLPLLAVCHPGVKKHHHHSSEGPHFTQEPASLVEFSNNTGVRIPCEAGGKPAPRTTWYLLDGSPVRDLAGLRQVSTDGTLIFPPFKAEEYRQDVHAVKYKCVAANTVGTIVSRDVHPRAVMNHIYDVQVYDVFVIKGNTGVLKCHVPSFLTSFVLVSAWIRDNTVKIESSTSDGKYVIIPSNGDLLIRDVSHHDARSTYRCETRHRLSTEVRLTTTAGRLFVTDPQGNVPPRILDPIATLRVKAGETAILPCSSQGYPTPSVTWYTKDLLGHLVPIPSTGRHDFRNDILAIRDTRATDSAMYVCVASNNNGAAKAETEVTVMVPLKVHLQPKLNIISPGKTTTLHCVVSGSPVTSVTWFKNGQPLPTERISQMSRDVIRITHTDAEDRGMYQCMVRNDEESNQASAELRLGEVFPELRHAFDSVELQPGQPATLQCAVSGSPAPQITWSLDGMPLGPNVDGRKIQDSLNNEGDSVSALVFRHVQVEEGGLYSCTGTNRLGKVQHNARLNIYGPPAVRSIPKLKVVAGEDVFLNCPMYGHPIDSVVWVRGGETLPVNRRQIVHKNGTLFLKEVHRSMDSGKYTCIVGNQHGQSARGDLDVVVTVPPKIVPFAVQEGYLKEGVRVILQCMVIEGDSPIRIQWTKDRMPIPLDLGIMIRKLDEFTSILSIGKATPRHNGNYTCAASNLMSSTAYSTSLFVNVAPNIIPFSFQGDHLFEGVLARVSCVVYQGDLPIQIQWLKDDDPVLLEQGIAIRKIDEFSSILTIDHVRQDHSGQYTCVAENDAASVNYTATLAVNVPPKIVPFSFQDEHLLEGMLVRVSCVVSRGDLPLTITWLKDAQPIPAQLPVTIRVFDEHSSVLSIDPLTTKHNGNYTCVASNTAATVSLTAQLRVNVPPKWTIAPMNGSVFAGKTTYFDCQADGFPKPVIHWYKAEGPTRSHQEPIHTNLDYQVFHNGSLHIPVTRTQHSGFYFCEATNGVGVGLSKLIHLTVHVPPVVEFKQRNQTGKLGDSLTLRCLVMGERPLKFKWKMDEQILDVTKSRYQLNQFELQNKVISELTIVPVLREDSTSYTCISQNDFGHDESQFFLTVQEPPHPPESSKVSDAGNRTVQISWKEPFTGNNPITSYVVQYRETSGKAKNMIFNETVHGQETSANVTGLKPSTKYEFRVLAENQLGWSKPGEAVYVTTGEEAPTAPPQMVKVDAADEKTLKVSWKPPKSEFWNGNIRGYFVGYKAAGTAEDYKFRLLEVPEDYKDSLSYLLTDLERFTQYSVVVQALNNGGKGPLSTELLAMTSEGVPSKPPLDVRCSVLTSQSVHVTWQPPPLQSLNGIIRGYKVFYILAEEWYNLAKVQSITVTQQKATLQDLAKYANYSVQVLSFTKRGDGVSSDPTYCRTLEDVPGAAADIRALSASGDSILVSWQPPDKPNGVIQKYFVSVQLVTGTNSGQDKAKYSVEGNTTVHEVIGLKKNNRYQFWVTAVTAAGEGAKSKVVTQSPKSTNVGARVASFSDVIRTTTKNDLQLPCRAAGVPAPDRKWVIRGEPLNQSDRIRVLTDGALLLRDVQKTDAGNYTCYVDNGYGDDSVTYVIVILGIPTKPIVDILLATATTLDIHWKGVQDSGSPIFRHLLFYRQRAGLWTTVEVEAKEDSCQLKNLICGNEYEVYVVSENKIGQSEPSATVTTHTKGSVPEQPSKEKLLEESSSSVTIYLEAWKSTVCPIQYFAVEYSVRSRNSWITSSDNIKPEQRTLVIRDLRPATHYKIRVSAHNEAGAGKAEYEITTLTTTGGTIAPFSPVIVKKPGLLSFMDKRVLVPAGISLIVFLLLLLLICCCIRFLRSPHKHKDGGGHSKAGSRHHSLTHHTKKIESDDYNDPSFTYLRGTAEGSSFSNGTLGSQDDPSPYATVHLSDFQSSAGNSLNSKHRTHGHSSLQKTNPAFEQALRIASGSITSSSDILNLKRGLRHIPTAPPMSESYAGGSCAYRGTPDGSKPLLPKRNQSSDHRHSPSHHLSGHDVPREETTFVFPTPEHGSHQGIPFIENETPSHHSGHTRQKSRFFRW